jgi:kinesin family member 15
LQDELIRTKSGDTTTCKARYFSAQSARESLHTLRVSLNRSLIFPHIEVDSEEEMDVDEEDVQELRDQISKIHSSSEDTLDDFMDAESGDESTPCSVGRSEDDQVIIDDFEGPQQEEQKEVSNNTNANEDLGSDRKSNLSIIASTRLSPIQDPTLCSSPKIHNKARMSITSLGLSPSKIRVSDSPGDRNVEMCTNSAFRSSLQSSKLSPTDSLAASLQRGLHIIEYHQQNPAPRKSFIGLSFDHFARQSVAKISSAVQDQGNNLCSFCKKPMNTNENQTENVNSDKQIVTALGTTSNESSTSIKVCLWNMIELFFFIRFVSST